MSENAYASTSPHFGEDVMRAYSSAIDTNYINVDGRGTSARHDITYQDYAEVRPMARIPVKHDEIMREMDRVYDEVGLIKNIIDLMADFVVQGINISHPVPKWQRFYRNWFNRIAGVSISERLSNNLFKYGTAIVSRKWARFTVKLRTSLDNARAAEIENMAPIQRGKIPGRYTFKNPVYVDVLGGKVATFLNTERAYGIKLSYGLANAILHPQNDYEKEVISSLPEEVKQAARNPHRIFPLDPEDTIVLHYKKNDWENWSKPIIYSVLRDVHLLQKLQIADFTALDGAVDHVRVWKLGSLDHKLLPNEPAIAKLAEMLHANIGAGVRNIIWGPDIELAETSADIHQFLGDDKYQPALNGIYAGVGIPPTLTGTGSQNSGTTNNLVSLKALLRRLDYVRQELVRFWTHEFAIMHQTLEHRDPAEIEFDITNFGDEEAEKKLWIDLADRNIVSHEWVQRRFGAVPKLEDTRLKREEKARQEDRGVQKAGPWHDPHQKEADSLKLKEMNNRDNKLAQTPGRPKNSRDIEPRKTRRFVPQVRARLDARKRFDAVSELVNPFFLHRFKKDSLRALSSEQSGELEKIKLLAFFSHANCDPSIFTHLSDGNNGYARYLIDVSEVESELGRRLTVQERSDIAIDIYLGDFNG